MKAKRRTRRIKVTPRPKVRPTLARIEHTRRDLWRLTPEEKTLVKNVMCPGATDNEFALCIATAEHQRLDPLKKQIWFVPRWNAEAEYTVVDEKTGQSIVKKGRKVWVAQTSIDGLRHLAARDHRDYGSEDEPTYGPMHEVKWQYYKNNAWVNGRAFQAPEFASVAVWKKGATRPTIGTVYWDEIYPHPENSPMCRTMPRHMLGKCAAAQAIRKAYPETGAIYLSEEFAGQRPDFSPEGRKIEYPVLPGSTEYNKAFDADAETRKTEFDKTHCSYCGLILDRASGCKETKCPQKKTVDVAAPPVEKVLYYRWFHESNSAQIEKPADGVLTNDLKRHLAKLVRQGHVAPTGEEFEDLKYLCQTAGITLKRLDRQPGE